MQATITYLLTEQAQRAQMAATGQPVARKQTVTVDVPLEDLELLQVAEDGTPYLDLSGETRPDTQYLRAVGAIADIPGVVVRSGREERSNNAFVGFVAPNPDVLALLKAGRAKLDAAKAEQAANELRTKAERKQREDDAIRAFLADPKITVSDSHRVSWVKSDSYDLDISTRRDDLAIQYREEYKRRFAEWDAKNTARINAEEDAKAAKEKAKTDFIAEWVANLNVSNDRLTADTLEATHYAAIQQQFADGLLCRQELLTMIADAAFAAAGVPEPAKWDDNFCKDRDCPCGSRTLDCLPVAQYKIWKPIATRLPAGYSVEFSRVRECLQAAVEMYGPVEGEGETAGRPRYLAEIKMPHGPFVFTRTIELR